MASSSMEPFAPAAAPPVALPVGGKRGPHARRRREIELLRARILDAAETLLVAGGWEQLSMRRLAETIEYAPSTLYGYFRDKQAILHAVLERCSTLLADCLDQAVARLDPAAADPAARLYALGQAYLSFAHRHPRRYELLFNPRLAAISLAENPAFTVAVERFAEALAAGSAAGQFRLGAADEQARGFWAACHGLASLLLAPGAQAILGDDSRLIEATLDLQLDGLRAAA
ncbi:MAG TPA: hypothetical protein DCZ72_04930 [Armatimonadetes bacterium]|nr:hypothetical protein [Armatimonadota bacterium]